MGDPNLQDEERRQPIQLEYNTPRPGRLRRNLPLVVELAIGFSAVLLMDVICVASIRAEYYAIPGIAVVGAVLCMIEFRKRRRRWRGFLAGAVLGIGLTILGIGACFVIVMATLRI